MKIEIGSKTLIGVACLSAGIALADFIIVADVEGSGGVTIEQGIPVTELDKIINSEINKKMPIGTVIFRMDSINPSTLYGGEWSLIKGDSSLRLGNGSNLSGLFKGENEPSVPLIEHSHVATQELHSHEKGTMNITGSFGDGMYGENSRVSTLGGFTKNASAGATKYTGELWVIEGPLVDFNANKTWTGSTSAATPKITFEKTGKSNATLNVRGKYRTLNTWKRIG